MSVFQPGNVAYGLSQALIGVPNAPIVSQRAPTTHDRASIGTIWIDEPTNTPYIITSIVDNVAMWVSMNASGAISSIVTDSGTATPVMGVINLLGGANIVTSAMAPNTVNVAVTPNINLPATNAAGTQGLYELGGLRFAYAYPPSNTFVGITAGNTTLNPSSAVQNTGIGNSALSALVTGTKNTAVGNISLLNTTTGINNTGVGYESAPTITSGSSNTALGSQSLGRLITGNGNIAIGFASAFAYTSSESSNITISSDGVTGESNVIRIGTQGTGAGEQDACAIAGIYNTPVGTNQQVMFVDSNGFLGSYPGTDGQVIIAATASAPIWANLTAGTNISIANAANSITINNTASSGVVTLDGDTGSATGSTVTITGVASGATVRFVGSGSTLAMDFSSTAHNTFLGNTSGNNSLSGTLNTGVGYGTLSNLTSGGQNTAVGVDALNSNDSGTQNTAIGYAALELGDGLQNTAVGDTALGILGAGGNNSAFGYNAGSAYNGAESNNICIGHNVTGTTGESSTIRLGDTAVVTHCFIAGIGGVTPGGTPQTVIIDPVTGEMGSTASGGGGITTIDGDTGSATGATLTFDANTNCGSSVSFSASGSTVNLNVTDGSSNTIIGSGSGNGTLSSGNNTILGRGAFALATTAGGNTAVGDIALNNILTGTSNTCIGLGAGSSYVGAESNNICVGSVGLGGDINTIRIGVTGIGFQTSCYIQGINGVTIAGSSAVLVNSSGQLGTVVSSRRYKDNIEDMDDASNNIMNLRPVTFNYKNDPTRLLQYGLIAEEVHASFPGIVTYNKVNDPETVRYHDLPVLLLNELQKQHNIIASLMRRVEYLENRGRYEPKA